MLTIRSVGPSEQGGSCNEGKWQQGDESEAEYCGQHKANEEEVQCVHKLQRVCQGGEGGGKIVSAVRPNSPVQNN